MPHTKHQSVINKSTGTASPVRTAKPRPVPMALKLLRLAFSIGGHLSPGLAGYKAYNLWFTPIRYQTPDSESAALESAEIEYHDINNQTIATYSWGQSGPTVLLVHGWSGRGTQMCPFVEPLINAGYRVLSFDAPAHGKSSGKQTNFYEVADVLLALQKHYGIFDSVITHSFGGPCIATALQHGLKASRVVSISPPASPKLLVERFISTLHMPERAGLNLMERIENKFGKKVWHEISMKNTVRGLNIPAMVIHDDHDTDVPWQEGQIVAQAWNNASFIKTTGLGHRRILRDAFVIESTVNFITVAS